MSNMVQFVGRLWIYMLFYYVVHVYILVSNISVGDYFHLRIQGFDKVDLLEI